MHPPVETVAGRYRLTSLIGKGGMGSVWRAEHTSLLTPVAIKLLDPKLTEKPSVRARFLREAQAAASLRSKHVVQILDHGVEDGFPYIVMELLQGESLGSHLAAHGTLKPRAVGRIIAEVGRAMARAHKAGIIHRDLKPDNVFLAEPEEQTAGEAGVGGSSVVKVVDFGIAKITDDAAFADDLSTDTGAMIGTPHYMSPEQARGLRTIDSRTDLWSMAVITYECLLGQRPFRADALGELVLKICTDPPPVPSSIGPVPAGFDAWFAKAIARNIDQRFQTVAELVYALEETLTPGIHHFELAAGPTTPLATPSAGDALESTVLAPQSVIAAAGKPTQAVSEPSSRTEDPATKSVAPTTERKSRALLIGGGLLAGLAVAGALALASKSRVEELAPASNAAPAALVSAPAPSSGAELATAVSVAASASAPPVVKEIVLTVSSTPAGAAIFRDGERLGKAGEPIRIPWTADVFEVSLRKDGYKSKSLTVTPAASVDLKATLELKPSSKETPF